MVGLQILNYVLEKKNMDLIINNDLDVSYFPNHDKTYNYIINHYNKYKVVPDKATVLDNCKGFEFIEVHDSESYLIEKIREERLYLEIYDLMVNVRDLVMDDSRKALEYLVNEIPKLSKHVDTKPTDLIKEADIRFKEYLEKTKNINNTDFLTTGFKELDEILGGWDCKEELAVIAGRTNQGKSWWLYYFLLQAAKEGKKVGLYSGEMTASKVGYRIDTMFSHISNFALTHGNISVLNAYERHVKELEKIEGNILTITPKELGGIATVANLRMFAEKHGIEVLGIDQYSLMEDIQGGKTPYEKLTNISKDLKIMQVELQIPIIVASQLNRTANGNDGIDTKQIAGSDRIGQDATTILGIEQKEEGLVLKIVKARDSEVGAKLTYAWDIDKGEFLYLPTENDATGGKYTKTVRDMYENKLETVF